MIRARTRLSLCCLALLAACQPLRAQDARHEQLLAPLVSEATFAVAYADLAAIDLPALDRQLQSIPGLVDFEKEGIAATVTHLSNVVQPLRAGGARFAYVVMGTGDVWTNGGPLVAIPLDNLPTGSSAEDVRQEIADSFRALTRLNQGRSQPLAAVQLEARSVSGIPMLLMGQQGTLLRYPPFLSDPRDDLTAPLVELAESGAAVGGVVSGGRDHRRALRETWPPLPGPFAPLTGELMADRITHFSISANAPPEWNCRLVLQTDRAEAARTLGDAALAGLSEAGRMAVMQSTSDATFLPAAAIAGQAVQLLAPTVEGNRLVVDLQHDTPQLATFQQIVQSMLGQALESSRRTSRLNKFKQLALGMHNFSSAQDHFTAAAAIRDADGRPLLSWRVLLLPYMGENELFHQFHFDEPWDSPHNRQLIEKMPDVYYDPAQPRLGREGKTTKLVPVHTEAAFLPTDQTESRETAYGGKGMTVGQGITFRDITDGTSNTIMLVDIAPSEAVIWTKPDDWEVDLADPHRGLRADGIKNFVAARCDGSVHLESMDISTEALRAMLTRASGDVAN